MLDTSFVDWIGFLKAKSSDSLLPGIGIGMVAETRQFDDSGGITPWSFIFYCI